MSVTETFPDWKSLQGATLDGGYELKDIIEAERDRAILRVRVLGDYTLKASASFYVLDSVAAEEETAIWQSVRAFERKANVSAPLGTGTLLLNGARLAYLVLENPEETLAEVLKTRPLLPDEATDVLRAVARGVDELHANGYVHGCLSPAEVRAVGDDIQVSIESLRRVNSEPLVELKSAKYLAPESGTRNLTIASDVWCLGATVFETLTQKKYEPVLFDEATDWKHPFGTLLGACLEPDPDKRCKLTELEPILRSKAAPPRPKASAPPPPAAPVLPSEPAKSGEAPSLPADIPAPPASLSSGAVGTPASAITEEASLPPTSTIALTGLSQPVEEKVTPVSSPSKTSLPVTTPASSRPSLTQAPPRESVPPPAYPNQPEPPLFGSNAKRERPRPDDLSGGLSKQRGWLYAVGAFLLIFMSLWLIRSHSRSGAVPHLNQPAAGSATTPDTKPGVAWPTKTLTPEGKTPAPPRVEQPRSLSQARPAAPATGQERTVWRVILYTYGRREDAQHRAEGINSKRPDLRTEVFASGSSGPYLVVAGGGMSRDAAVRLRLRAVREGMPRDTYIQNYSR